MNIATVYIRSVVATLTVGAMTCIYIYYGGTDQVVICGGFAACVATVYLDKDVSGETPTEEQ